MRYHVCLRNRRGVSSHCMESPLDQGEVRSFVVFDLCYQGTMACLASQNSWRDVTVLRRITIALCVHPKNVDLQVSLCTCARRTHNAMQLVSVPVQSKSLWVPWLRKRKLDLLGKVGTWSQSMQEAGPRT